jgi:nitronate monooxygenase
MWPRKDLIDLLGITHPIIQAPMAGSTTPALAAAVSNAGGLGSLGCARETPDSLRERAGAVRRATNKPYNLNFFIHKNPRPDANATARVAERLKPLYDAYATGAPAEPESIFPEYDDGLVAALLEIRPPIVSFHFSLPDRDVIDALKKAGSVILSSGTAPAEARWLEDHGADAVIAQSYEAGGHQACSSQAMIRGWALSR